MYIFINLDGCILYLKFADLVNQDAIAVQDIWNRYKLSCDLHQTARGLISLSSNFLGIVIFVELVINGRLFNIISRKRDMS